MREISIQKNEAGQRMDKFLAKYLNKAPKSFFYGGQYKIIQHENASERLTGAPTHTPRTLHWAV